MAPWKSWIVAEKARRCLKTMFFVAAMTASLLASSFPILVAVADVAVTCAIVSGLTCHGGGCAAEHLRQYNFKSSFIDIPVVSFVRSLVIICLSWLCNGSGLSPGPYLGAATLCSIASILLVLVKACVMAAEIHMEAERTKIQLQKTWKILILLLSCVVFGLAHILVAYRTSRRAKRKLLYHRIDQEAVLSCKRGFSGYQKVHRRSLTMSSSGKTLTYDTESKQNPPWRRTQEWDGEEVHPRMLANPDSLFITIKGLTVHYKLCSPSCPPETDLLRLTRPEPRRLLLHRSYSIQLDRSSLYDPLLRNDPISYPSAGEPLDGNSGFGVVLIHGFGGGVFSWRHVMTELSKKLRCVVTAFDRPGWGLTSRLLRKDWEERHLSNPYKLESQVDLLLSFCSEMGFSSVVLVGHDDGGLLALRAAERVQDPTFSYVRWLSKEWFW